MSREAVAGTRAAHLRGDKYFRGRWRHGARLEIGFYARGTRKSQIAVQVSRLAKKSEVETVRATWKAALTRLEGLLED